jgi:hypothetical protein
MYVDTSYNLRRVYVCTQNDSNSERTCVCVCVQGKLKKLELRLIVRCAIESSVIIYKV